MRKTYIMQKVKNTKIWWPRKTSYPQDKNKSTIERIEVYKRTQTSNILMLLYVELTDMTTCQLRIHRILLSWIYSNHKYFYLWLWDSSQRFCCSLNVLYAATETTIKFLMWILILIALCVCLKVQTSQISQKNQDTTQQRLLKRSQGFSFYARSETLNPTRHMGLGCVWNFCKIF